MIQTSLSDVKEVLKKNLSLEGVDIDSLTEESPLFEGLGLDSLDAIELVIILRKNYDIVIENMAQGKEIFSTMGTLRKYIEENRKK
ncbi:acyl carrier protein [Parelusimicrobium proximum]|uniref:phosphopantetheine-binding protein n=1 Tax=Parelusimicrobium proximum TaxID=3228953 RepID=UPI003D181926